MHDSFLQKPYPPVRSAPPRSPERGRAHALLGRGRALLSVSLAPMPHGAAGLSDELVPFLVVLLLISVYLLWAKSAVHRQDEEDRRPPPEGEDRARKD